MAYPPFHERGPRTAPTVMSIADFAQAFPGEGDHIEFKQGIPEEKVREAVGAFSNADGGVVLLGVRDDGTVTGLDVTGETEARVHRLVLGLHDPGRYLLHRLSVSDRTVLVISVQRRRDGFTQLADGRVLLRRGAMNSPLFGAELRAFVSSRSLSRFEGTPVRVELSDADDGLLERVRAAYGWSNAANVDRLHEAGLVEGLGESPRLTVAGALSLTNDPATVLGKAYVEIFRFRGGTTSYDKRVEVRGPIDHQVAQTVQEVMDELGSDMVILGVRRFELPRIPEQVLREAVANAVAHRDYEVSGQGVRVEIWPDRLVVRSPGGLPEPVTLENLREQNAPRNLDTIRLLRRYRLAEDAGMGIDVMEDGMEAALLERPAFESDGSYVAVSFTLHSTVTPQERAWIGEIEQRGQISSNDRVVLLHAARGEVLTNGRVRDLLGVDSVHARASLARLRDLGHLAQSGERAGSSYSLARDLGPPRGLELGPPELRSMILSVARETGRVTNETIRGRTGLERAPVLAMLNALVQSGELERHGERRGSYYTAVSDEGGTAQ